MIEVRIALPGDAKQLPSLRRRALALSPLELTGSAAPPAQSLPLPIPEPAGTTFVAVAAGTLAGMIEITPERVPADLPACMRLTGLWVEPALRRQGVARLLLLAALTFATERGAERVVLEVHRTNTGALALFRSAGFVPVAATRPSADWLALETALPVRS